MGLLNIAYLNSTKEKLDQEQYDKYETKEVTLQLPWLILYFSLATVAVVATLEEVSRDLKDDEGAEAIELSGSSILLRYQSAASELSVLLLYALIYCLQNKVPFLVKIACEITLVVYCVVLFGTEMVSLMRQPEFTDEKLREFSIQRLVFNQGAIILLSSRQGYRDCILSKIMYSVTVFLFAYIMLLKGAEYIKSVVQIAAYSVFMLFFVCHHFWTFNKAYRKHEKASKAYKQVKEVLDQLPTGVAILHLSKDGNFSSNSIMYHNAALTQIVSKWDSSGQIFEEDESNSELKIAQLFQTKRLFDLNATKENQPSTVIEQVERTQGRKLTESGATFLVKPEPDSAEWKQRLVHLSRKQIEFNGWDCEIVYFTDKSVELQLRINQALESEASAKLLQETKALCAQIESHCQDMIVKDLAKQTFCLDRLREMSDRLLYKTLDRLDYRQIQTGEVKVIVEEFTVEDMLHGLAKAMLYQTRAKNVKLEFEVHDRVPKEISTDRRRFEQVLINLLENAVLYSQSNSRVIVEVGLQAKNLVVSVRNQCKQLLTGQGSKLFSKFFRANGSETLNPHGVGLGLFISKQICTKILNGSITCTQEPFVNEFVSTCFRVQFMVMPKDANGFLHTFQGSSNNTKSLNSHPSVKSITIGTYHSNLFVEEVDDNDETAIC